MFYICCKQGNKLGIMDSTDNVLEFYTRDEVRSFIKRGITILDTEHINEVIHYVWHYTMNTREFSSSEFDFVIDFMEGKCVNNFRGSRHDYAKELKSNYLQVKSFGFNILPSEMFSNKSDLLVNGLLDLYGNRDKTVIKDFADKWKLNFEVLNHWYGI